MPPAFTARVRNIGRLQSKVKKSDLQAQANTIIALRGLTEPIEQDIKSELNRPKSGPTVTRYRPRRTVKVSLPGEPPARDRGELVNSIDVDVDPVQFNLTLSALADHARHLEFGTRHMLPRPFLRPALTRWRARIIEAIRDAIKRSF